MEGSFDNGNKDLKGRRGLVREIGRSHVDYIGKEKLMCVALDHLLVT